MFHPKVTVVWDKMISIQDALKLPAIEAINWKLSKLYSTHSGNKFLHSNLTENCAQEDLASSSYVLKAIQ